jgi:hypothetical protein
MCPRCLSLYQLPLKGFWKWPQFSETIITYLIPIVRIELAASMRICSPPSPSSSPPSSERWKSDQIIILTKKNCPFPLQLPVQICSRASALSFLSFWRKPKVVQVRDDDAKWILEGGGPPGRFRPTANGEHVRNQAANKARGG